MGEITESQRKVLKQVAAAGDDGLMAKSTEPLFVALWKRDLLDFYAPESLWFITEAGRSSLSPTQKKEG